MSKPKLRFPEFTGDWEQHKLGNICKTYSGGTPKSGKSSYYDNGTIPFIRSGEIHNDRTELYITEDGMNESSAKMVDIGDILYALYGATSGEVDISKINGAINQAILCIKPTTSFDRKFIVEILRHNKESILRTYLQGGQGNLSAQIIQSQIFNFPCLAEQQKIASLFTEIDTLIQSAEKELEGYRELKQGMLQKMFPKNGETTPEIRFPEFTGDWEQRKVGEFLTESRESGHKGDVAHKLTVKLWGKGVYEKNEVGSVNTQYFTRHAGQFIYSKLDFLNCAFGVVPEELESFETTADLPAFDCDGVNPHFMFYTAIQPSFYEKNGMIADGSRKAKRIHVDTFLDMPFVVPSLEEQNKIVNLLSGLDDLLTLQQKELDGYKELKKGLLQQMFC